MIVIDIYIGYYYHHLLIYEIYKMLYTKWSFYIQYVNVLRFETNPCLYNNINKLYSLYNNHTYT